MGTQRQVRGKNIEVIVCASVEGVLSCWWDGGGDKLVRIEGDENNPGKRSGK